MWYRSSPALVQGVLFLLLAACSRGASSSTPRPLRNSTASPSPFVTQSPLENTIQSSVQGLEQLDDEENVEVLNLLLYFAFLFVIYSSFNFLSPLMSTLDIEEKKGW